MSSENNDQPKKQSNLTEWLNEGYKKRNIKKDTNDNVNRNMGKEVKPKLAFGFGYDPKTIKNGINNFNFSHSIDKNLKLYEFNPNLSYKIFNTLATILKYKCIGSELKNGNTTIKNNYFITDKDPKQIVKEINRAITKIFKDFDPIPKN